VHGRRDNEKEVPEVLRARLEVALSVLLAVATILTAVWPAWIEGVLRVDPDGGNGTAEWGIVITLAAASLAVAMLARRDLRVLRTRKTLG
jgi:hypothetical protein